MIGGNMDKAYTKHALRIAFGIMILFLLLASVSDAATITVNASGGADYTRIQDAINDANNGDTILVSSGNYTELQVNVNKQLILKGINTGGGKPVVEGSDSANGGAIILTAGGITLEGFNTDFRTLFNRHNSL
jgi:pectin methylesterase-like acyl-CoA thioesterase